MAIRSISLCVLWVLLVGCSDKNISSTCIIDERFFHIKSYKGEDFLSSINFDIDAGIAFRGFDFIASATDVRNGVEIFYDSYTKEFLVKTKRNERLLKGVEKQCIADLEVFLSDAKIEVPIVMKG
jgi:hypothetical protein